MMIMLRAGTRGFCGFGFMVVASCADNPTGSAGEPDPEPPGATDVRSRYLTEFGESVPRPAIFTCAGASYLTTVSYLPDTAPEGRQMLVMHLTPNASALVRTFEGRTAYSRIVRTPPVGAFRILTVVFTWPQTFTGAELPLLEEAQRVINQQHATFAQQKGYPSPIVSFEFTNIELQGSLTMNPNRADIVALMLEEREIDVNAYDFLAVINIDPQRSEGGFAAVDAPTPNFIYMGNYGGFNQRLTGSQMQNIANSVYHHEVSHHWGWAHDWTPECGADRSFAPFITAPLLLGWEDVDGDGIPEIRDPSPYGRG